MCDQQVIYITPLQDKRVCTECGMWGMPMYFNEELKIIDGARYWKAYFQGESLKDCFKNLKMINAISKDEYFECVKRNCRR
jgi:hypothetical protein